MKRYSNIKGVMVRKPKGGWVTHEEAEQQIKELGEYAQHGQTCELLMSQKGDKCSCGLNKLLEDGK